MKLVNNIIKCVATGLLATAALTACSEWTNPEPVDFRYVTIQEKNPELYQAYLQSLRDYRDSEHKIVVAKFNNKTGAPSGRADHLTCLPDSVDYIIFKNATSVDDEYVKPEMAIAREQKGQKILYEIDYSAIVAAYKEYKVAWEEEHQPAEGEEANPADEAMTLDEYVSQSVAIQVKHLDTYGYDGINIVASFKNPVSCNEEQLEALKASQEAFLGDITSLISSHKDMLVFFEGTPHYLVCHEDIVENCDYIIIPAESATNSYECTYELELMMRYGNIPVDRFILGVTTKSLADPSLKAGSFSGTDRQDNAKTAIIGGAEWVVAESDNAVKAGLCINNAENDYFNLSKVYYNIREAISIMNPSPIK
ncbi:MAG: glycoside hydrolase family 18 [Candidatus Cryptobacteroides sp.]